MWNHRNGIVHGSDAETSATRIMLELQEQVKALYNEYHNTPHIIQPIHSHLFTRRTLDQRQQHNYDNLTCWLQSVTEAKLALAHQVRQQREQSSSFFTPAQFLPHAAPLDDDSNSESYTISSNDSNSTYTTVYSTSTQDASSSSNTSHTSTIITDMSLLSLNTQQSYSSDPPSIISWGASTNSIYS